MLKGMRCINSSGPLQILGPTVRGINNPQSAWVGDQLIEHRDLKRTAFYADFGRHYDVVRVVGGRLDVVDGLESIVSVNRGEHQDAFDRADLALLDTLMPHIRRALQIHRRLVIAERSAEDFAAVLDLSPRATLLLDARGRVIALNAAAAKLLSERDGLRIDGGELAASSIQETDRLRQLTGSALNTATGRGLSVGGISCVTRPSGRSPFVVLICPLAPRRVIATSVQDAAIVAFVTDPERVTLPDGDMLRDLYELTPAEVTLTKLLVSGHTLEQAAGQAGLSIETVRTRVKTIFHKTDTHRQSELIRLVLALPARG